MVCMKRRSPYTKISLNLSDKVLMLLDTISDQVQLSRTSVITRFLVRGIKEHQEGKEKIPEIL
jgi:hypothetical protein